MVDGVRSEPLDIKAGVPQVRVKHCWVFFDKIETMNIFKKLLRHRFVFKTIGRISSMLNKKKVIFSRKMITKHG